MVAIVSTYVHMTVHSTGKAFFSLWKTFLDILIHYQWDIRMGRGESGRVKCVLLNSNDMHCLRHMYVHTCDPVTSCGCCVHVYVLDPEVGEWWMLHHHDSYVHVHGLFSPL